VSAANQAFLVAMRTAAGVSAVIAMLSVVVAVRWLPGRRWHAARAAGPPPADPVPHPPADPVPHPQADPVPQPQLTSSRTLG
jgi:hypothetical protein